MNIQDTNGWTPLHHAVPNNALNAIEFLLDNGVDDVRLNKQEEAPIHLAIIHNQLKALGVCLVISLYNKQNQLDLAWKKIDFTDCFIFYKIINITNMQLLFLSFKLLLSKRPGQVNLPGERRKTPLHYAALIDNIDAAKILVSIEKSSCSSSSIAENNWLFLKN